MKLHIVYIRTFENSPDVRIITATTDKDAADKAFAEAKLEEAEWNEDDGSGCWAEACMDSFDMLARPLPGDTVYILIQTVWHECVETVIEPFLYEHNAKSHADDRRKALREEYPNLTSFDEDIPVKEAMHLEDPSIAVDIYLTIEKTVVQ